MGSEAFEWSTGLPDDFNFLIEDMHFAFDPEAQNTNTLYAYLIGKSDDSEIGDNGEYTIRISCGSGWDVEDRGAKAVREDGNDKKGFNVNSSIAKFYAGALECDGADDVLFDDAADRGDPRKASTLISTAWHMKQVRYEINNRDNGQKGEYSLLIPDAFLGVGTDIHQIVNGKGSGSGSGGTAVKSPVKATGPVKKASPATNAAKKAPGATKAAAPKVVELDTFGPGHELWQPLYNLAMECDDEETFQIRAFEEIDGFPTNDVAVLDVTEGHTVWNKAVEDFQAAQG